MSINDYGLAFRPSEPAARPSDALERLLLGRRVRRRLIGHVVLHLVRDMDPKTLQRLREESGLRLDREGRFWHRGEPVEHARTAAVLHQGIHRAPDGRWATRIGGEWAYLDVEDAALWIRRIEPDGAALRAQLASGGWVRVDPRSLAVGADDALYARVVGERARFTRAAQVSLSDCIREEGGRYFVEVGGTRYEVGRDAGPEPRR